MKVCILHKIPGPAEEMLKQAGHEVVFGLDKITGADAILSLLTDKIDASVMDAAGPQLKIIANYAVGFDNVDLEAAKARNVFVTNTPGGFECAVAEHTLALMLAVARKIVTADKYVRDGNYHQWEPELFIGMELAGKTIGIVGMGRIGSAVAKICEEGFGMKVVCFSRTRKNVESLAELLKISDVISLHVPLNAETRHLIGPKELSLMKKSAILINTARGAVVDELALIEALKGGWIAGAGLDVFEDETNIDMAHSEATVNPELLVLPNVVLTPHIASATLEARSEMSRLAAENIIAALSEEAPMDLVKSS